MKIDIYNHIFPKQYQEKMIAYAGDHQDIGKRVRSIPMLSDLDVRFRVMDEFGEDYVQVLSTAGPGPDTFLPDAPDKALDLAKAGNDGMAELCQKYPDRFIGFTATMAMNNIDGTVEEVHRAIRDLGARGIQFYTNVNGEPLDDPKFLPVFDAIAAYDLPIWVHPVRPATFADYKTEERSKFEIWWTLGWPYETSVFMSRMVFSGMFDRHPDLKIITHHMGGMIPYFEGRVGPGWDQLGSRTSEKNKSDVETSIKGRPVDYFKNFYADTAVFGAASATRCGLDFFGADHVVFASDAPFDPEMGQYIRETVRIVDELDISAEDRRKIYQGNAEKLLKLNG